MISVILSASILGLLYLPSSIVNSNQAYALNQFKVNISFDQDPIQQGDTQKVKVTVRDANTNNRLDNALVKLTIDPPSGKTATGSSHTNNNGQTTFKVKINSNAATGTYDVKVKVSGSGYATKTFNTSFEVTSNNNNDNNNHNNGNDNGNENQNDNNNGNNNNDNNNDNNDQVQVISQANVCGNRNDATDVDCQNLASQVQGDGNAVNVIGVQTGGEAGDSTSSNGGQGGGQTDIIQSGTNGNDNSDSNGDGSGNSHRHHAQSQAIAQANVCGNGNLAARIACQNVANQIQSDNDNGNGGSQAIAQANVCGNGVGASNVNCQNLANQIQGADNAVNVIGVQ